MKGVKMKNIKRLSEKDIINMINILPENKKIEVFDFLNYLVQKFSNQYIKNDINKAVSAVEDTWGSIKLENKALIKYIAEDKEIEYEF